mmetsp:Transcript_20686/g.57444  ORF Transcript_20686/g.57444 Transcript_20686/m.57444 type:complete len:297 (-) Transcript_20686:366-1256(-)
MGTCPERPGAKRRCSRRVRPGRRYRPPGGNLVGPAEPGWIRGGATRSIPDKRRDRKCSATTNRRGSVQRTARAFCPAIPRPWLQLHLYSHLWLPAGLRRRPAGCGRACRWPCYRRRPPDERESWPRCQPPRGGDPERKATPRGSWWPGPPRETRWIPGGARAFRPPIHRPPPQLRGWDPPPQSSETESAGERAFFGWVLCLFGSCGHGGSRSARRSRPRQRRELPPEVPAESLEKSHRPCGKSGRERGPSAPARDRRALQNFREGERGVWCCETDGSWSPSTPRLFGPRIPPLRHP